MTHPSLPGHFLLAFSTTSSVQGHTARISSAVLKGGTAGCQFRFWYHFSVDRVDEINIFKRFGYETGNDLELILNIQDSSIYDGWDRAAILLYDRGDTRVSIGNSLH